MSAALDGLLAGYGIAIPVGAMAVLLLQLAAHSTTRIACAAALGIAGADGLYATTALLAGAGLAPLLAPLITPLRWIAATVLVLLAVRTAVLAWRPAGPTRTLPGPRSPARGFATFFGLTMLNPATVIYFAALLVGNQYGEAGLLPGVLFVGAAVAASASWQLLLVASGRFVSRFLTGTRGRRYSATAASTIIVVLAAGLVIG